MSWDWLTPTTWGRSRKVDIQTKKSLIWKNNYQKNKSFHKFQFQKRHSPCRANQEWSLTPVLQVARSPPFFLIHFCRGECGCAGFKWVLPFWLLWREERKENAQARWEGRRGTDGGGHVCEYQMQCLDKCRQVEGCEQLLMMANQPRPGEAIEQHRERRGIGKWKKESRAEQNGSAKRRWISTKDGKETGRWLFVYRTLEKLIRLIQSADDGGEGRGKMSKKNK